MGGLHTHTRRTGILLLAFSVFGILLSFSTIELGLKQTLFGISVTLKYKWLYHVILLSILIYVIIIFWIAVYGDLQKYGTKTDKARSQIDQILELTSKLSSVNASEQKKLINELQKEIEAAKSMYQDNAEEQADIQQELVNLKMEMLADLLEKGESELALAKFSFKKIRDAQRFHQWVKVSEGWLPILLAVTAIFSLLFSIYGLWFGKPHS